MGTLKEIEEASWKTQFEEILADFFWGNLSISEETFFRGFLVKVSEELLEGILENYSEKFTEVFSNNLKESFEFFFNLQKHLRRNFCRKF